jgi:hypothetical protein
MGALDTRLYTSPHTPTDAVSQLKQDCVKLACPGCWWPSAARLSLLRYCTHNPHSCTVLRAHNLPTHDLQDGHALNALFQAALPYMPETVASDTDASGTDHSLIDSQESDASDD